MPWRGVIILMTRFTQLLAPSGIDVPSSQQEYARKQFPELVSRSNLRLWKPGDEIPNNKPRLLLGVATYSDSDMRLLDALDERVGVGTEERVDVFNVLDCKSQSDFAKYVPGISRVFQSPVVGVWEDGTLKRSLSGSEARHFLIDRYKLSP